MEETNFIDMDLKEECLDIDVKKEFDAESLSFMDESEFQCASVKEEFIFNDQSDSSALAQENSNFEAVFVKEEPLEYQDQEILEQVETARSTRHQQEQVQNPWPHLDNYYLFKSREGGKLIFNCRLCLPKIMPIKGHITSLSNLKRHIKRTHPGKFTKFEEKAKTGSTRGKVDMTSFSNLKQHIKRTYPGTFMKFEEKVKTGSTHEKVKQRCPYGSNSSSTSIFSTVYLPPVAKKARQQTIDESFGITTIENSVPQAVVDQTVVDQRIVELFISNMLPLHVVESDTFERLIKTLNPSKSSISIKTLCKRIVNSHTDLKQYLIRVLGHVQWVATTADCWSAHKKNYLTVTVHWLDPASRQRQHAVLACIRLTGHHTYNVLAKSMINIHYGYHIEKKVTRTTTDNSRNFVKDFVQFGAEADIIPDLAVAEDVKTDSDSCAMVALLAGSLDEQELEYVSLADSLVVPELIDVDAILDNPINLPTHMRCAAHNFNLVASKDADAALQSSLFKGPYRAAMFKAFSLWNLQNCSTVAVDTIYAEGGRRLVVPNTTRWNSIYDSLEVLNTILDTKRPALQRVMTQLKINCFNDQDVDFMKEYAKVMSPVTKALDKIQGKDQAYLGTLLPTVVATVLSLKDLKFKGLVYCSPLVDALLTGIDQRFGLLLKDEECQLAAAFHPRFRLIWLEKYDSTQVSKVRKNMEGKVEMAMRLLSEEMGSSNEEAEDDFFSAVTRPSQSHRSLKGKAQNLVKTWLETNSKEFLTDAAFLGEQVLVDLFIKFNTAIPSSAAVERLFSMEKDILLAKRSSLSDENFETLIFTKGNMHLMEKMENEKKLFPSLYQ